MASRFKIEFRRNSDDNLGKGSSDDKAPFEKQSKGIIKRLIKFAIPYWHLFGLVLLIILAASASSLARPYLVKIGIDNYIQGGVSGKLPMEEARRGLYYLGVLYFMLVIGEFVFGYLQHYILH